MSKERFGSVWDAIEDTQAQAENMRLRRQDVRRDVASRVRPHARQDRSFLARNPDRHACSCRRSREAQRTFQ